MDESDSVRPVGVVSDVGWVMLPGEAMRGDDAFATPTRCGRVGAASMRRNEGKTCHVMCSLALIEGTADCISISGKCLFAQM